MKKHFDLYQKVTVTKGPFKGTDGKVTGYGNGKYNIRFGGRGRRVVFCEFRSNQLKAKSKGTELCKTKR